MCKSLCVVFGDRNQLIDYKRAVFSRLRHGPNFLFSYQDLFAFNL